jgi:transcription initiation factor TFIIIB Brf1 subunit/transcription initiation factor TFIIB
MRHCPNCDCEVIVWDAENEADKCLDCGESWTLEEQKAAEEEAQEELEHQWDI